MIDVLLVMIKITIFWLLMLGCLGTVVLFLTFLFTQYNERNN